MRNMKKMFSVLLATAVVLVSTVFLLPVSAANTVTLNTEDTNTLVDMAALGLSGSFYSIAQNQSLSFQVIVPETEASKYITILRGTAAGCLVKMDVVSSGGTTVFSKTQEMMRANDLFAGVTGKNKDEDGAVMELSAGTYTVTLTNTSATAFGFKSLEFRDVILPLGTEKTAFSLTDAYYQYTLYEHTSPYTMNAFSATPEDAVAVGGNVHYHMVMHKQQGAVLRMYIYAEKTGKYDISIRSWGKGGITAKVNENDAITIVPQAGTSYTYKVDMAAEPVTLVQGLNTIEICAYEAGVDCLMLEPSSISVTLNTEETYTVINAAALGYADASVSLAQNECLKFKLIVPETEDSRYIAVLSATAAGCLVKMDVTNVSGTTVFSKTQEMKRANDLFAGVTGTAKDTDGAVMELAAGTYIVTLTNTSAAAFGFKSVEFRDVILPLDTEKTALHITDAYYQYLLYDHTCPYTINENSGLIPAGAKTVGGSTFYHVVLEQKQGSVMKLYVDAEVAGTYDVALQCWGAGGASIQGNENDAVEVVSSTSAAKTAGVYSTGNTITLTEGLNTVTIAGTGAALGANALVLTLKEEIAVDYPDVTLNTADTNSLITLSDLGLSGNSYVIEKGRSIGFDVTVFEAQASKYIAVLRGLTTGPVLTLSVTDADGNSVYSKSQNMTLVNDTFTGVSGEGRDYDGGVIELAAGTYTVKLTNTSDTDYHFVSMELRNVILPLGAELTAFHTSDAFHQDLLWWHTSRFTEAEAAPEGAVSVGGEEYYHIFMKQSNTPDVRYYIYAEEAGDYRIFVRTRGGGGIIAKANSDAAVTVVEAADAAYSSYRIDTCDDVIKLNQGLNQLSFSTSAYVTETAFDCFMLQKVESVWAGENALNISGAQDTTITVTWEAKSLDNVSSWEIFKNGISLGTVEKDTASYTYSGLTAATSYELAVKAILADGTNYDTERTIMAYTGNFPARENLFTTISAGHSHFIGINKNGKLNSFGSNTHGQASTALQTTPVFAAAGAYSSYAIDENGDVYSWGSNFYGQLGLGTEELSVTAPTKIDDITRAVQVAAGTEHALVLTDSGEVYAFGNNRFGQLGTGNMEEKMQENTPVLVTALSGKGIVQIAAGSDVSYAVSADGTLYTWGANYMGQLGDGNDALDNRDLPNPVTVSGKKVLSVEGGGSHTIALCYTDANGNNVYDSGEAKAVYAWGADSRAQLATGDLGKWVNEPMHLASLDGLDVVSLATGDGHTLVLTAEGDVYGWGWNGEGQLGVGTAAYVYKPAKIYNIPKIKAISAGYAYSVALAEDGRTYAWGTNAMQQITNSSQTSYNIPVITNLSLNNISVGDVKFQGAFGETTEKPQSGGKYTISARCYNDSETTFSGNIHICVYDMADDKPQLISAMPVKTTLSGKTEKTISAEVTLPTVTDNVIVKIFAWDDAVTPYSDAAIVK